MTTANERRAALEAELELIDAEEKLVAAKKDRRMPAAELRKIKEEVRARRALARAGREYAAAEADGDEAAIRALDALTQRSADVLGLKPTELRKARERRPVGAGPNDALAVATPASATATAKSTGRN